MIRGKVHSKEDALTGAPHVVLSVARVDDPTQTMDVEALLDTGFTAYLTLPLKTVGELGLPRLGTRSAILANGEIEEFDVYAGLVSWNGHSRNLPIFVSGSEPLLGMALLWGQRITIEAWEGGDVIVEAPTSES